MVQTEQVVRRNGKKLGQLHNIHGGRDGDSHLPRVHAAARDPQPLRHVVLRHVVGFP